MKIVPKAFLFFCLALLASLAWGDQDLALYVFNQPFQGKLLFTKSTLYAEASPFFKLLNVSAKQSGGKVLLIPAGNKDNPVQVLRQGNATYVPVKKVTEILGLSLRFNPQTGIADIFQVQSQNVNAQRGNASITQSKQGRSGKSYDVRISKTEVEKGIDEMVVFVTIENKGENVPSLHVICRFKDQDGHDLETQNSAVANFAGGQTANVYFKIFYPHKNSQGTYRDYDTNIGYDVFVAYP